MKNPSDSLTRVHVPRHQDHVSTSASQYFNMFACCVATRFHISRQTRADVGEATLLTISNACWRSVIDPRLNTRRIANCAESQPPIAIDE